MRYLLEDLFTEKRKKKNPHGNMKPSVYKKGQEAIRKRSRKNKMSVASRDSEDIFSRKAEKALYKIKKVSREYQVPYLAGYSKDRETFYIDCDSARGFEDGGQFVETDPFLCVHEFVEDSCITNGAGYPLAHSMGTAAERGCVEDAGVDWKKYCDFMDGQIKKAEGRKIFDNLPSDLDLRPYIEAQDKMDLKLLKRMGYYGNAI